MRISDWSSDVCSSDLAPARQSKGSTRAGKERALSVEASAQSRLHPTRRLAHIELAPEPVLHRGHHLAHVLEALRPKLDHDRLDRGHRIVVAQLRGQEILDQDRKSVV